MSCPGGHSWRPELARGPTCLRSSKERGGHCDRQPHLLQVGHRRRAPSTSVTVGRGSRRAVRTLGSPAERARPRSVVLLWNRQQTDNDADLSARRFIESIREGSQIGNGCHLRREDRGGQVEERHVRRSRVGRCLRGRANAWKRPIRPEDITNSGCGNATTSEEQGGDARAVPPDKPDAITTLRLGRHLPRDETMGRTPDCVVLPPEERLRLSGWHLGRRSAVEIVSHARVLC
jgi:hypothetical protein